MRLSIKAVEPFYFKASPQKNLNTIKKFGSVRFDCLTSTSSCAMSSLQQVCISSRWKEFHGIKNWEGLLDPLDNDLRGEIIRYGNFVEAAYRSCDFEPTSPSFAQCKYSKKKLLIQSGYSFTGYRVTANLTVTSGIQLPQWTGNVPKSSINTPSSWIGYVAVCHDKRAISRLGRRDVVIALRGTTTCLEWLENLRANLTPLQFTLSKSKSSPMVQSGFLSLYTSKLSSRSSSSLQDLIKNEVSRIIEMYGNETLSFTFTGHSLGAALATLAAYDIKETFPCGPHVTVVSFGGPRVGNQSFRLQLEKQGTKVLRIVNSDDVITKVPGFVLDKNEDHARKNCDPYMDYLSRWIQRRMEDTRFVYDDVGSELRLSSRDSRLLTGNYNIAACHELKTYLGLVDSFVSTNCPLRATAKRVSNNVSLGFSHV